MNKIQTCFLFSFLAAGCVDTPNEFDATPAALTFTDALEHRPGKGSSKTHPRLKAERLAPDQRRVMLFVFPGDASIEVDGRPAIRRNGFVELIGKVGEARKVRVFKGARSTEEKTVTIGENEATPAGIDLNEAVPVVAGSKTKKAKPIVFGDIDE